METKQNKKLWPIQRLKRKTLEGKCVEREAVGLEKNKRVKEHATDKVFKKQ